jgi:hypothetical protein
MLGNSICFQGNLGANGMKLKTTKFITSHIFIFLCKKEVPFTLVRQLGIHGYRGAYICDSAREPLKRTHGGDTVIGRNLQFAREEIGVTDFTVYMTDNQLLQLEFS